MKFILWLIAIFVLLIVQVGILKPLNIFPVNLLLIVITIAALTFEFEFGLFLVLISGIMLDFISGLPDGLLIASSFATYLILYFTFSALLVSESNLVILFSSVLAATVIFFVLYLVFHQLLFALHLTTKIDIAYLFKVSLPIEALFNLVFTYPIYKFFSWIQKITHLKQAA